jgi:hypothetical protein
MISRVIYYPYIKVPRSPWFTQVLLYWDEVGAIVPYEYIEDPDSLGPYMVSLVKEQLVRQVIPGMYLWKAPKFVDAFLEHIDKQTRPVNMGEWPRIHMEKLQLLGEKLCDRGLARRDKSDMYSPWFEVEQQTADEFMAYLAAVLGQISENEKFYPITDAPYGLAPFIGKVDRRNTPLRKLILEHILPAPSEEIEPGRLADFKAKYRAELTRFRNEIEYKISELSLIGDEEDRDRRLQDVVNNLKANIAELTARMQEQKNWPKLDFGTLCTIIGSGMSAWKAVLDQDWTFGIGGAALSLAPAVYSAFQGSTIELRDEPLAYAVLTQVKWSC